MVKGEMREVKEEGVKMIVVYNRGCCEDVRGGTTIRYPFCEDSEKNCCLKSHVNGPISYL